MSQKIKYSIVIPSLGKPEVLMPLLVSLKNLNTIEKTEILVVINPIQNIDATLFSDLGLTINILFTKKGVNIARNAGLNASVGELIFFLDDDCVVTDQDFLNIHERAHQMNPEVLAVGGFYRDLSNDEIRQTYNLIQTNWLLQNRIPGTKYCHVLLGGHFSMKRISPLPQFDESIQYGGSETEFFYRLAQENQKFIQIEHWIEHRPNLTVSSFSKKAYLQGLTHFAMQKRNLFPVSTWQAINNRQQNRYEILYQKVFNSAHLNQKLNSSSQVIKNPFKTIHEEICFYLENRKLF